MSIFKKPQPTPEPHDPDNCQAGEDCVPCQIAERQKRVEQLALNETTRAELQRTYRVGDVISPRLDVVEPLRVECKHFIECITENKTPRTDGAAGIGVVQVLEAATRSLREGGRTIDVEPFH